MLKLLRQDATGTFSDLWYKVGPTRPRLSPHAQVIRQKFGSQTSFIIEDPAGGQYYRLSEAAYHFVGLLDGRRTINDAWDACNAQLGDTAPTQRECIELLSKLQLFGMIAGDMPLAADMIEARRRQARTLKVQRRTGRGVSMTVPLLNPEPWLEASRHILRAVFSKWGALAWILVVVFALYRVFLNRAAFDDGLSGVLDPGNLLWLGLVFIILRAWHELGHAAACKAMGARCTEMGMMVIALVLPFPYCDTSAAWRLPQVWKRVIVSAGGVIFETFLAALAAIAWSYLGREDAGLLRSALFNMMVISGVSTLVFNLNPLLRYDGYYILSDIAGSANLAQRSQELIKFLIQRFVFQVSSARPPQVRDGAEFWLLLVYALLSWPYRLIVVMGIVLVLWSNPRYLTIGAVLAVIAGSMWVVWPFLKSVGFLLTSPALMGRRVRAVTLALCVAGSLFAILGLIPMPAAGYATGTLEPRVFEPLRPLEDGFIQTVHVRAGDFVNKGDPVITMYNAEVLAQVESSRALVAGARTQLDASIGGDQTERVLAENRLKQLERALLHAQDRADALVIRARASGRVVPAAGLGTDMDRLLGGFFARGALLASVASTDDLIVRCLVPDREAGYIFRNSIGEAVEGVDASIKVRGRAGDEIDAKVERHAPAGTRQVGAESLTNIAGGEVIADPSDPHKGSVVPHWVVEVSPQTQEKELLQTWKPGLRARVRFGVAPEPLLQQWLRRARQYLADKAEA